MRGVSRDARAVLERGAAQAGKTLGQYLSEDVAALVLQQLQVPAAADSTLHSEIQYLRQLVENLTVMLGGGAPLPAAQPLPPAPAPVPFPPPTPGDEEESVPPAQPAR
ncbi:hypothetical protein GCM10023186_36020 [Hymenobacter koreensis]|uniref:Uncharacterized protein n=1 Tax=Hymenobacter koreensis TaxID=1084523 RepID=A0ABP8JD90_9BACT